MNTIDATSPDYVFEDHVWLNRVHWQSPDEVVSERLAAFVEMAQSDEWKVGLRRKHAEKLDRIRDVRAAYHASWRARGGKQKEREYYEKRKQIVNGVSGTFTDADWRATLAVFSYKCAYCGADGELHRDHFYPIQGVFFGNGMHAIGNIVPVCKSCNSSKSNSSPDHWVIEQFGYTRLTQIKKRLSSLLRKNEYADGDAELPLLIGGHDL